MSVTSALPRPIRHTQQDRHRRRWFLPRLLLLFLLTACGQRTTPTPPAPAQPTVTIMAEPVANETMTPERDDQLVVWLPSFTGIGAESGAGALITNAFHQFEQEHPTTKLDVEVKADTGVASLLNFLRSAQQVAPTILPDLVLINSQQLWQIVDLGMVVALREDEQLPDDQFFAAANEAVAYRNQTVGIPYTLDIIHLAYDSTATSNPPNDWTELLADEKPILFPAAEVGTLGATLLQYAGAGGELLEDGVVSDPAALEAFFQYIADARDAGVIPAAVLELPGFNAVWRDFADNRSDLAMVQVVQFLPNVAGVQPPSYAAIPTRSGEDMTLADCWAFAILTEDEQRRRLALSLVQQLLLPEVQGAWSQSVARLPSQPVSLALWTQANDYRAFAESLLVDALVPPNGPAFADFARRLHAAQAGVIAGKLSVNDAIASMVVVE